MMNLIAPLATKTVGINAKTAYLDKSETNSEIDKPKKVHNEIENRVIMMPVKTRGKTNFVQSEYQTKLVKMQNSTKHTHTM